jgi:proteic killer suppression protein
VIVSYRDKNTEKVAAGIRVKRLLGIRIAVTLEDLAKPPGNRLEALRGDRQGQHSVRINDQYRICFSWKDGAAHEVEITDYH